MTVQTNGETLRVSAIPELGAADATEFRDQVRRTLSNGLKNIEVDLSQTTLLDSSGLGALIALHKTACSRGGILRLLHPLPPVLQILELTRMHRILEIVKS